MEIDSKKPNTASGNKLIRMLNEDVRAVAEILEKRYLNYPMGVGGAASAETSAEMLLISL